MMVGSRRTLQDLAGKRFGRLVVSAFAGRSGKHSLWRCRCDCGVEKAIDATNLTSGAIRSCGCLRREALSKRSQTHGLCETPEYGAWCNLIQRCYNQKHSRYADYGGRGIRVCQRWLDSFEAFYADMGHRPTEGHSIDRYPDNDGNYEPGNCRWATASQQNSNQRRRQSTGAHSDPAKPFLGPRRSKEAGRGRNEY